MTRYLLGTTLVVLVAFLGTALTLHNWNTVSITANNIPSTNVTETPSLTGSTTENNAGSSNSVSSQTQSGYTMAQVKQHATAASCWTAINGNVYDLTSWINQHPGGVEPILSLCGTDGSAAFNAQHGGQGQPARELATFLLGPLAQQ